MILFVTIVIFNILQLYNTHVYVITEHPQVTYVNDKHVSFANLTAKRYGRSYPPIYYFEMHLHTKTTFFGDNFVTSFHIYEYLSNEYRRSFVEMYNRGCGFFTKNPIFGIPMGRALKNNNATCPVKPGFHHWYNMSVIPSYFPPNFPFKKGRIYCNLTVNNELAGSGYIDMEIREYNDKNDKKKTKNKST